MGASQGATAIEAIDYHGMPCFRLRYGASSAIVARYGAQVLSWIPEDGAERLFLSDRAAFDAVTPIRGGIPVCFPQFSGLGDLPKHGFVRTRPWAVASAKSALGGTAVRLRTRDDENSRVLWPCPFEACLDVELAKTHLTVGLLVRNTGSAAMPFTGALHTYLRVDDIEATRLVGLKGCEYRDAAGGNAIRQEAAEAIAVTCEVDRVYHAAPSRLRLEAGTRSVEITGSGFPDVVVWNPWRELCARMGDMEPDGYRRMLCVEAAVAQHPVVLEAGASWSGTQTLAV